MYFEATGGHPEEKKQEESDTESEYVRAGSVRLRSVVPTSTVRLKSATRKIQNSAPRKRRISGVRNNIRKDLYSRQPLGGFKTWNRLIAEGSRAGRGSEAERRRVHAQRRIEFEVAG
ncbi:MAG: hypothetical protein ACKPKO_62725, partial [Candidatus Fonsibacter sp.]